MSEYSASPGKSTEHLAIYMKEKEAKDEEILRKLSYPSEVSHWSNV